MKFLPLLILLALTGCATAPYSTQGWKAGDRVNIVTVQNAQYEIVTGNAWSFMGPSQIPLDAQTKSVVDAIAKLSTDQLKVLLPQQTNEHTAALVQAEINLHAEGDADNAWKQNWCAQAGQSVHCLDRF